MSDHILLKQLSHTLNEHCGSIKTRLCLFEHPDQPDRSRDSTSGVSLAPERDRNELKMWCLQIQNVFFPADARKRAQQWKRGHQHWRWSHRMEDQVLQLNRHTVTLSHTHTHTHNLFFYLSLSLSLSLSLIPHFCLTLFRSVLLTGFSVINTSLMFLTLTTACWHLYFWKKTM